MHINKKLSLSIAVLLAAGCFFGGCGGNKQAATSSSSASSSVASSSSSSSSLSAAKDENANAVAGITDWTEIIDSTKKDVLKQEKLVKDVAINIDNDKKTIVIALVCNNAIKGDAAVEAADTAIRRLSANAQMKVSGIKSGGKDYWGGVWDVYTLDMRVARQKDTENQDKWMIYDIVQPGVQGNHKFKVKEK